MGTFEAQNTIIEDSEDRKDSRILFNAKKSGNSGMFYN